jgi:hypothetical protein
LINYFFNQRDGREEELVVWVVALWAGVLATGLVTGDFFAAFFVAVAAVFCLLV